MLPLDVSLHVKARIHKLVSYQKTASGLSGYWRAGRACIFRIPHLSPPAKSGHKSSKDHWQETGMVVASTYKLQWQAAVSGVERRAASNTGRGRPYVFGSSGLHVEAEASVSR